MTTIEDRLRASLRSGAPLPLDADDLMHSARRRRTLIRARVGTALLALVLVAGVGFGMISRNSDHSVSDPDVIVMSTAPATPPAGPQSGEVRRASPDIVPGRSLRVSPESWCLVGSSDGREFACALVHQHTQRVTDDRGAEWLVMLAPSGPQTSALQVEQPADWVLVPASPVPGSHDHWVGVVPSDEAPEAPRALRALSAEGGEVWRG